MIKIMWQILNS